MTTEIWKDITRYEGFYQVSNKGRVRSLDRVVKTALGKRRYKSKIMATPSVGFGYATVTLSKDNEQAHKTVHELVLTAFVGPCPEGMECRHLNGNPTDNKWPENICWGTRQQNVEDSISHNTFINGENNYRHKLKNEQVIEIYMLCKQGHSVTKVAQRFNISRGAASCIKFKRSWKHLTGDL